MILHRRWIYIQLLQTILHLISYVAGEDGHLADSSIKTEINCQLAVKSTIIKSAFMPMKKKIFAG